MSISSNTITLYRPVNKAMGYFSLKLSGVTTITFSGATVYMSTLGVEHAKISGAIISSFSAGPIEYFFYLEDETVTVAFGDITKLDWLDLALDYAYDGVNVDFEGMDIEYLDVLKLNNASRLRMRYSVRNLRSLNQCSFYNFPNLTDFSIGCTRNLFESVSLHSIKLSNARMSQMTHINWLIKRIPFNFPNLVSCKYLYLLSMPRWTGLTANQFGNCSGQCLIMHIPYVDEEDYDIVASFVRNFFVGSSNDLLIPAEVRALV